MRFLALLCAILVLAPAARATQDAWPALYDVDGVDADDVLNIRSGPTTDAPVIGSLAPDTAGVEVIEPDAARRWGRINAGEGTGWVSFAYLRRQPGQWQGAVPQFARCVGAEPFWSLARDGGEVVLRTPETTGAAQRIEWEAAAAGRRNVWGFSAAGAEGAALTGIVRAEACSDTMSDRAFGLSLFLLRHGDGAPMLLSGCCSLAP